MPICCEPVSWCLWTTIDAHPTVADFGGGCKAGHIIVSALNFLRTLHKLEARHGDSENNKNSSNSNN
eukprot:CAMPEP_0115091348 /NCGR_PEP_ID=MMETSP0227-20121206/26040_1 /TAXON_ID=89957 /ORGANISM="Polarella glacialis, Strain CCMP 1383" /LENGTH=66 /DNA_ID=CAMNT_0002482805 /DNA_START=444 /DNA_END=641 /DNA_ORIENTATION=+